MLRHRQGFGYSVVDLLASIGIVFLVLSLTLDDSTTVKQPTGTQIGLLSIELTWSLNIDADVDLWVKSPDDTPVGYSRSHGLHFDLIRDDLGRSGDPDSHNIEIECARDTPPGEYIVDAVLYNSHDHQYPVHVRMSIQYGKNVVLQEEGDLKNIGDEITLVRFNVDKVGHVSYVNNLYQSLFTGKK